MTKYTNLNQIIQKYTIEGIKELQELQKTLSDVPVLLDEFEKYLKWEYSVFQYELSDLTITAGFYNPEVKIYLLDELVNLDEADELTERMVLPYPRIIINSAPLGKDFCRITRKKLDKLILPDKRDPTSRVLTSKNTGGVAVVYERENRIHYLEMLLIGSNH